MGKSRTNIYLTAEKRAAIETLATASGTSMTGIVNKALDGYVLRDTQVRTLINGLGRLRRQVNQQERLYFAMMQFLELFATKSFILAPTYNSEELRNHVKVGRENFNIFMNELIRKNENSGMPVFIERLNAELLDQGEEEID